MLLATVALALLVACTQPTSQARQPYRNAAPGATAAATPSNLYTDPALGFRLALPDGWHAISYPGQHRPSANTLVVLREPSPTAATITLGVFHGAGMPTAFAARGNPPRHVGSYPAFTVDTGLSQGKVPCLVRIMLADEDYIVAEWCAMDAASHAAEFERILATYAPAPASFVPSTTADAPHAESCAATQAAYGYGGTSWGHVLATPDASTPDGGWSGLGGTYVCSNTGSPDHYLFQCTELVNRWDAEQWGLPHIPGSAARYFDYYQNGTLHPGSVRDLPTGAYSYSDDASQGQSAFAPQPGDLLIFQDVANPGQGWTSGLIASPGHVALITAVDASHVYVAQENYNDHAYFLALTMRHIARGYTITDRSGVPGRIVRGWIHFTVENS